VIEEEHLAGEGRKIVINEPERAKVGKGRSGRVQVRDRRRRGSTE